MCPFMDQRGQVCVRAVTLQWWCTKSWFCWWRSWVAATRSWLVSLENPFGSTLDRAAAAVCVYPAFPCQGIYPATCAFSILTVLLLTVPVCLFIQTVVVLAEDWSAPVCNPEDGVLYLLYSIMDQWQLWPLRCKKTLHFSKMHMHIIESEACCGFPLAWDHRCSDLD